MFKVGFALLSLCLSLSGNATWTKTECEQHILTLKEKIEKAPDAEKASLSAVLTQAEEALAKDDFEKCETIMAGVAEEKPA